MLRDAQSNFSVLNANQHVVFICSPKGCFVMPLRLQLLSLSIPSDFRYDDYENYHLKYIQKLVEQKLSNDLCIHGAEFTLYFRMGIHGTS